MRAGLVDYLWLVTSKTDSPSVLFSFSAGCEDEYLENERRLSIVLNYLSVVMYVSVMTDNIKT